MIDSPIQQIALNARFRRATRLTGVQNWSAHLAEALKQLDGISVTEHIPNPFFATGIRGHFWEQFVLPIRARNSDVLLSPGNSGPILCKRQLVCVHDAMVFTNPKLFSKTYRALSRFLLRNYRPSSTRILTVSKGSMAEIRKQTSSKLIVQVVGAGLPKLEPMESTESPKKYFLFIGGDIERKNLNFLIPIWGEIFESTRYRLVVVVGEKSASLKINDLADIEGITYVINPNNMQLATLYQGSRALLWPSLAEGFGMPLLEAMSFGKSFISTSVGAAKELRTGESKILPLDASLWRDKIVQTISHPQTDHSDQIHKAHEYTWENVAKNVKKAIDSFLL